MKISLTKLYITDSCPLFIQDLGSKISIKLRSISDEICLEENDILEEHAYVIQ